MSREARPARIDVPASATPAEAAALVAAVEQFLRDTTPVVVDAPRTDAWTRVARTEAVSRSASWDAGGDGGLAAWTS